MVHLNQVHKRQAPGFTGAATFSGQATDTAALPVNTIDSGTPSGIPLTSSNTITTTTTSTSTTPPSNTDSSSTSSQSSSSSTSSSSSISISTVVGACVGALAGALLLILIGLWLYKRSAPKPRQRTPVSPNATRNARGDLERTRSRTEAWDKLEDRWEGQNQTKEISHWPSSTAPATEVHAMSQKSPNVGIAAAERSFEAPKLQHHPFAQSQTTLTTELQPHIEPALRPFLGRVDAGPAMSWDSSGGSFLSLHSRQMSEGTVSASIDKAIPTPDITNAANEHRWHSAEILQYNDEVVDPAHSNNPFNNPESRRKSLGNNPFFGSKPDISLHRTSSRRSSRSSLKSAFKDPFGDENVPSVPQLKHAELDTDGNRDDALQSLIAALDFGSTDPSPKRAASMQPSVYSGLTSIYTEDDVTDAFPLPPGSDH